MYRLTLITIMILTLSGAYGQEIVHLIDYDVVISDLAKNGQESYYFNHIDYEALLYLEKQALPVLEKVIPDFLKVTAIDTSIIFSKVPDGYAKYYNIEIKDIRELFYDKRLLRSVCSSLCENSAYKLDPDIYIKDKLSVVFTLFGSGWQDTYRATLINKRIEIDPLYKIIE